MDTTKTTGLSGIGFAGDGDALIQFDHPDGPITLTFPSAQLHALGALAFDKASEAMRRGGERVLQAFDVADAPVQRAHDGHVLLTMTLPTGTLLTFRLHPTLASRLGDRLSAEAGAVDLPPDAPRN